LYNPEKTKGKSAEEIQIPGLAFLALGDHRKNISSLSATESNFQGFEFLKERQLVHIIRHSFFNA